MAQIGTIKLETQNSGTVSVPVFATGDSGSSVHEFLRVQTAGGTGFIPLVAPADASFPYLRVQSQNHGVVAAHDASTLISLIDSAEDGDLSEYDTNQSGAGTGAVSSTFAIDGSYIINVVGSAGNDSSIVSLSGLPAYPELDQRFKYYARKPTDEARMRSGWFMQNSNGIAQGDNSGYGVNLEFGNNVVELEEYNSGSGTDLARDGSVTLSADVWYRVEVLHESNGSITLDVYNNSSNNLLTTLTATDTTFTSGGILMEHFASGSGGSDAYWDFWTEF